jgi:succinyl-diaminopimelate desuccinylase
LHHGKAVYSKHRPGINREHKRIRGTWVSTNPLRPVNHSVSAPSQGIRALANADDHFVISVLQELVSIPTRGGIDPYDTIIDFIWGWFKLRGIGSHRLRDKTTDCTVALICDIQGTHEGPHYVLDACLNTAPFGDPTAWRHPPTSGIIEDGWLHGRGAADSKAAIAIFMHLVTHVVEQSEQLSGSLTLLFDADEHTGRFGGAKQYFSDAKTSSNVAGVMVGYPGIEELVIGGRGFLRADVTVHGTTGHTGGQRAWRNDNAIEKAARLIEYLAEYHEHGAVDTTLGLPPRLTATGIAGGDSYSIIPDCCTLNIDIRLTTTFDEEAAKWLVSGAAAEIDRQWRWSTKASTVAFRESWPAYRLSESAPIRVALQDAAERHLDKHVNAKAAGPSNIGNYLAKLGIPATAGLGVRYAGLHGTDERIDIATIPSIQSTYHEAVLTLLAQA